MKTGRASRRARWQEAWVTSLFSHPPDLAGIPTSCPNSVLSSKTNAQLMGVVYNKHGQATAGQRHVAQVDGPSGRRPRQETAAYHDPQICGSQRALLHTPAHHQP
jgi:hypothetical protein